MDHLHLLGFTSATAATTSSPIEDIYPFDLWHCKLGHLSRPTLNYLVNISALDSISSTSLTACMDCK